MYFAVNIVELTSESPRTGKITTYTYTYIYIYIYIYLILFHRGIRSEEKLLDFVVVVLLSEFSYPREHTHTHRERHTHTRCIVVNKPQNQTGNSTVMLLRNVDTLDETKKLYIYILHASTQLSGEHKSD